MRLAAPVAHPEQPGHDLLKAGFTLTPAVIDRLKAMGVSQVFVDYPDLAALARLMPPSLRPTRQVVYKQVRDTLSAVQRTTKPTVAFHDYYASMREMVITLMQGGQHPVYLDLMAGQLGAAAVAHATAVAHLALVIGLRLEDYLVRQRSRLAPRHAREAQVVEHAGDAQVHD